VRFDEMTFRDIKDASNRGAVALILVRCAEQQSPHLPVGSNTWLADQVKQLHLGEVDDR
jgi:hypothetical protein